MSCKEITRGEVEVIEQGLREAMESEPWLDGGRWSHVWRVIRYDCFIGIKTPGFIEGAWLEAAASPRY